jgi:hypothetical protein
MRGAMSDPSDGASQVAETNTPAVQNPKPRRERRIGHILRSVLKTTIGKFVLAAGAVAFLVALYGSYVVIFQIYLDTFPEMHAFASPTDFHSLPFAVENKSNYYNHEVYVQSNTRNHTK